jgi:hypothetical protein
MSDYVNMNFVNQPEISAVIVEHLIKTRVPMEQQHKLKEEVDMCSATVKEYGQNGFTYGPSRVRHEEEE